MIKKAKKLGEHMSERIKKKHEIKVTHIKKKNMKNSEITITSDISEFCSSNQKLSRP